MIYNYLIGMVTNLPINLKVDQDIHSQCQAVVQDHQVLEIGIKGMRDLWDKIIKDPRLTWTAGH